MNAINPSLIVTQREAFAALPSVIFWLGVCFLLPIAALFGGMPYLLVGLAVILAVVVYRRPQEAPGVGILYLFACNILLPHSARFDGITTPWEMYYWAIGLLIVTTAAVARIGLRQVFAVPRSAKAFLLVAFAAAVYGQTHGAAFSYVSRQFYGVLMLIVYLGIAIHVGDEELLLRRIQVFGTLCAFCFVVYYVAVFAKYGFHKEIGFNGTEACLLSIVLFIQGLQRRKIPWILTGLALLLVPILFFMRGAVLTFLMTLPLAVALKVKSKKFKVFCWATSTLIALPAIFPPVAQVAMDEINKVPGMERFLPPGIQDSDTLFERVVQLGAAVATVQAHPLLGAGIGSEIEFDSPTMGARQVAFVDSGWAYLLQKMGVLGAVAFTWLLITIFGSLSKESIGLSACLLSAVIVTLFSQPVFFHFTTSPFMGTFAGLLLAAKHRRSIIIGARSQVVTGPGFLFTLHKKFSYALMKAASSRLQKD
jgi:hypothetical protein